MSLFLGQAARNLLDAPLVVPDGVERLGRALWLYVRLLTLTNNRGLIIRRSDQLADDLRVSEDEIDDWLIRLAEAKLVEVQVPAPYLVIKLGLWSDESSDSLQEGRVPASRPASQSYSSALAIHDESKSNSNSSEEGTGSPEPDALLAEILSVLGESDPTSFRPLLTHYPPEVIRGVLQRVRTAGRIRKSKTALFRYLLGKLTDDAHAAR
jgi:hypothetical protein